MMSSTIPSAKYSCSGSELRLVKGRMAIEGLLGRARVSSTGQRFGTAGAARPYGTRQTRIGSAIFFKDCEPISSNVISILPRSCRRASSVMLSDFGIENRSSKRFQSRQRAFFVDPYQAARARDIRRQNSRQSPLYMIAAQDAPPRLGEIECSYSTIVGPCPAIRTSEMGPGCVKTRRLWLGSRQQLARAGLCHARIASIKPPTPRMLITLFML